MILLKASLLGVAVLFAGPTGATRDAMPPSAASPRPEKKHDEPARPVNRLSGETSPYLLQHAHNPVDWYPWGEEALRRAREEKKPIFLSIGYSACHWCHVMERESFEDAETAKILNAHFVAIKVDREERPDIDDIYMTAVQLMTGHGGWPLSVFLTPDLKPFYGGTYFPPVDRHGLPSFRKVLTRLSEIWREQPDDVRHNGEQMVRALRDSATLRPGSTTAPADADLGRATSALEREFDPVWGGFGGAPKFPPSAALKLLMRQMRRPGGQRLTRLVEVTLDRMAQGGMFDQIGGGFHRYSVDAHWLVPHFEKMLYDNAILARVYLEAWQATHHDRYRRVATGILDYVLRDMTDPQGGFHSAEDADSEGVEGKFYVWSPREIKATLGEEDGALFCKVYGVTEKGNFEQKSILHVPGDPAAIAKSRGISPEALEDRLGPLRETLLGARAMRVRPGKDDKVLAAWNGMMISAFARGYQVVGDPRYRQAAERAAAFVLSRMVHDGKLLRTYRGTGEGDEDGVSKLPAYLDDYAEVAGALLDLYEATFDARHLQAADRLARVMVTDFWDAEAGGFFYTSDDHKHLLVRTKPFYDGAVPSGNAVAAHVLLRLAKLLGRSDHAEKAEAMLTALRDPMVAQPRAHLDLLRAADRHIHPPPEIAIVGSPENDTTRAFLRAIHERFIPDKTLALVDPDAPASLEAARDIPLLKDKTRVNGMPTVYVCENFTCKQPLTDVAAFEKMLDALTPPDPE